MITLITAELSSGFDFFIYDMPHHKFDELNISDKYIQFPEFGKTELEIFDWIKRSIKEQSNISILTNSCLVRDLYRLAFDKKKLNNKLQNIFIDRNNNIRLISFDDDGRSETWIDGNLDLGEKVLIDMFGGEKSNILDWS